MVSLIYGYFVILVWLSAKMTSDSEPSQQRQREKVACLKMSKNLASVGRFCHTANARL